MHQVFGPVLGSVAHIAGIFVFKFDELIGLVCTFVSIHQEEVVHVFFFVFFSGSSGGHLFY